MSYIPHPSLTAIRADCQHALWSGKYNVGDPAVFHRDDVLRGGLRGALEALRTLGVRHGDVKCGNVLYCVERGRVWVVDLESVEKGAEETEGVLNGFWRYELCEGGVGG